MQVVNSDRVAEWIAAYERAWRSPGTASLGELFSEDVSYLPSPWAEAVAGLDALAAFWERTQEPGEEFDLASDVVAVDGDTAVARVEVEYTQPSRARWRNLWVMRFAEDGRCRSFEEWPFAPRRREAD